jgi:hypothetical protein
MISKITTFEEAQAIVAEFILNYTDNVTKINDLSVLNGIGSAFARILQLAQKENTLLEAYISPDSADGTLLDRIASTRGISTRFGALGSSTYIRLVGDVGTTYTQGVHTFIGASGVTFDLVQSVTIGSKGYIYALIRSQSIGSQSNVPPLDLRRVNPTPAGHQYAVNEYQALGGRDNESDRDFRERIKETINMIAKNTISGIERIFQSINNNVLRVFFNGYNASGQAVLGVITQNGAMLLPSEIDNLLINSAKYFALTELKPDGSQGFGISIKNIEYFPIDVSFRCKLLENADVQTVRQTIQIAFAKEYDWRYWEANGRVEWDDLLEIVKSTEGIEYVFDDTFYPRQDFIVPIGKVPRFRGFIMLDSNGALISGDFGNELNPAFYPAILDFSYQNTILTLS